VDTNAGKMNVLVIVAPGKEEVTTSVWVDVEISAGSTRVLVSVDAGNESVWKDVMTEAGGVYVVMNGMDPGAPY
jgi:hypothetical protein